MGIIDCDVYNGKQIPYSGSAFDMKLRCAISKHYSEHLERSRIGYNNFIEDSTYCFNIENGYVCKVKRTLLGYGFNEIYGMMDTTGTAAGVAGRFLINKAYNELLEKNELAFFWYMQKGYEINIDTHVQNLLKEFGLKNSTTKIFATRNLGYRWAIITMIFENEKLIASGISSNENIILALRDSISEAKLILLLFEYLNINLFNVNNLEASRYILNVNFPKYNIGALEKLTYHKVFDYDAYCAVLNNRGWQANIAIRVFSKELLNCLPKKENILNCLGKAIVKKFMIDSLMKNTPDCIVV